MGLHAEASWILKGRLWGFSVTSSSQRELPFDSCSKQDGNTFQKIRPMLFGPYLLPRPPFDFKSKLTVVQKSIIVSNSSQSCGVGCPCRRIPEVEKQALGIQRDHYPLPLAGCSKDDAHTCDKAPGFCPELLRPSFDFNSKLIVESKSQATYYGVNIFFRLFNYSLKQHF